MSRFFQVVVGIKRGEILGQVTENVLTCRPTEKARSRGVAETEAAFKFLRIRSARNREMNAKFGVDSI